MTPWQGVRLLATGEVFQYENMYSKQFTPLGDVQGSSLNSTNRLGANAGWESVGAEATIWSRQTESSRYNLNVSGSLGLFPGGGFYTARELQQIGLEAGARWRLDDSGLSLNFSQAIYLQRFDNPGEYLFFGQARLLLANDDYGVAAGPVLTNTDVLSHARFRTGWTDVEVGGEALVAPFHNTQLPVLKDMTIDLSAMHSIGQASLFPVSAGSTSAVSFAAVARFNFRY